MYTIYLTTSDGERWAFASGLEADIRREADEIRRECPSIIVEVVRNI